MRGHHEHAIGKKDRFSDVVGHVDNRLARRPPHLGKEPLHLIACQRIERRERLVHKQHRGIVSERAGDRDPLLHAAREMMRIGAGEILKLDEAELFESDRLAFRLRPPFHFQPEGDIAERGAPGKELREILEYDAAVGDKNLATMFKSVDLPHPLGPTMQRNSEDSMPKLTPWTAGTAPLGVW